MREIKIYTTPFCGFCQMAKKLLNSKNLEFNEVDVSGDPALRQQVSASVGGYSTVPMIFIGEEFIGGFQELSGLERRGELDEKLRAE